MPKVSFDGPNKLIIELVGTPDPSNNTLDVQVDIYSEWKTWVATGDNAKYLAAIRSIGGDPITGTVSIGGTYFLINGWRIRPAEVNHILNIDGNLYVDGGGSPYVSTIGSYNVQINTNLSNIINTVNINGPSGDVTIDPTSVLEIAQAVETQLDPILSRILGLTHNNFKLNDQQYDSRGNMTYGKISLYDSASDLNSSINPIAEYEVHAAYDSNGRMTEYKSIAL